MQKTLGFYFYLALTIYSLVPLSEAVAVSSEVLQFQLEHGIKLDHDPATLAIVQDPEILSLLLKKDVSSLAAADQFAQGRVFLNNIYYKRGASKSEVMDYLRLLPSATPDTISRRQLNINQSYFEMKTGVVLNDSIFINNDVQSNGALRLINLAAQLNYELNPAIKGVTPLYLLAIANPNKINEEGIATIRMMKPTDNNFVDVPSTDEEILSTLQTPIAPAN